MKRTKQKDKEWAEDVKARDKGCVICGKTERMNAHHIIPKEIMGMRYKTINGITLCPLHHRFSRKLSAHQNPLVFFKWMQLNRYEQIKYLISLCDLNNTTSTGHGSL